ncbi:MAG: alanine racemase [Ignavibacteria bacterium]|nr:alanine racemase [Ignavibacteria bacterium]
MRPTFAEINLSNLIFNYQSIAKKVGKDVLVMPVVKADAYGHGMIKCVEALLNTTPKPKYFAVALVEEAIEFKRKFPDVNVLVFGKIYPADFKFISRLKITPTVYDFSTLKGLAEYAEKSKTKINIHLKIDTGMGRVGIQLNELEDYLNFIKKNKSIYLEGVYTHFATSDHRDKTFALHQLDRFNTAIEITKSKIKNVKYFHAANSGAILDLPQSYFNIVRPGISLYGYYPSKETSESIPLKPVMSIKTKVAFLKWVEKNTSVSYGRTYFTNEKTQIGTLPIGYADGYNRLLSNKGKVIYRNKMYDVVGRVTMDQIMVNFGCDDVSYEDEVIVLGSSESFKFDADDIAQILNTIPYEVCTSISKRVKRKFIY